MLKEFKLSYSHLNWNMVTEKMATTERQLVVKPDVVMDNPHKDTIPKLLEARLTGQYDEPVVTQAVKLIKEVIDGTD